MMCIVVVPNELRDAINAALDRELAKADYTDTIPQPDREVLYSQLLSHFHEHGTIPEFSITRRAEGEA